MALFISIAGLSSGRMSGSYFDVLGLHVPEVVPRLVDERRLQDRSSIVIACTLAPAVAPLCAIGVAIEIAFAQLWPGKPGNVRRDSAA